VAHIDVHHQLAGTKELVQLADPASVPHGQPSTRLFEG